MELGLCSFRRWAEQGVWDALLQALVDLGLTDDWQHMIESTTVRGHVSTAGGEASDFTTAAEVLMALSSSQPNALLAYQGYDGDSLRESLLICSILPIIPPRSNRKNPDHPDYRRCRDRNPVERMFGNLEQQRRIAAGYDKTVLSFESFLNLAAAWLKSYVNAA